MAVIGIHYEEFEDDTYDGVYVYILEDGHMKPTNFNTGDIIEDFKAGLRFGFEKDHQVTYSSTVDNFIIDNDDYGYEYDDELEGDVIVKIK